MNLLKHTHTYMIGHMQYANGEGWRDYVKAQLEPRGIICFDPYHKPFINDIPEDDAARLQMLKDMDEGRYDVIAERMRRVRACDLNLCDRSEFIMGHIIPSVASWGTAEELVTSVRMKKPIFLSVEGGKKKTPLWVMGMIPHKYIYDSIQDAVEMVKKIDDEAVKIDSERWRLLRHEYR